MDTKKIGAFLKQCRKENNLTQEQLAEKFGVSARTVSRWETGSNMPDLSILVELADYYDIEIKELLDGERSSTMNKEMKETLNKVADYEEWVKQKALKAGNLAFASMFLISVGAIIIQLLLAVNLRLVLGETLIALVGGIVYAFLMVHNGIWDKGLSAREAISVSPNTNRRFTVNKSCMIITPILIRNIDAKARFPAFKAFCFTQFS